ncbi:hypothetical protein COO91_00390 [Nostoc flagelliforme CCNUN1]|uniref:Uncharacterized protein n=1 Tax=Nostoc flagelliforme CCNUN1 TaxID=2038116 RepID=A0A2K8SH27_9NOSO|nr:hypothetical protein COO91_00390 [Nostoc flagelliforme CCNUN1]
MVLLSDISNVCVICLWVLEVGGGGGGIGGRLRPAAELEFDGDCDCVIYLHIWQLKS